MGNPTNLKETLRIKEKQELETILSVIHANYLDIINMESLEEKIGITEKECNKLFHNLLKMTPMEYIRQHRIKIACQLLVNTDLSVIEISQKCGVNNGYLS